MATKTLVYVPVSSFPRGPLLGLSRGSGAELPVCVGAHETRILGISSLDTSSEHSWPDMLMVPIGPPPAQMIKENNVRGM